MFVCSLKLQLLSSTIVCFQLPSDYFCLSCKCVFTKTVSCPHGRTFFCNLRLSKSILSQLVIMYFISSWFFSDSWNILTQNFRPPTCYCLLYHQPQSASSHHVSIVCVFAPSLPPSQALYGSCEMKGGESLAVWTLKGTSLSDNKTRVVCQKEGSTDAPSAVLHVYGEYSVILHFISSFLICSL